MSPGDRVALGRREPVRPQYGATAPGFPPYYPNYGVPHPNAWLGAPLISMASRNPPARHTPISKLAMHAQGAPLIIQNRYDRRKFTTAPEQRVHRPEPPGRCEAPEARQRAQQPQPRPRPGRNNNTDAVSIASDESSGSNNSETMLPRIIKPRKRRKKDRKPNNLVPHDLSTTNLEIADADHCGVTAVSADSQGLYEDNFLPYRLDVKVLEYPDPTTESYRVSALGEALEATRFGLAEAASPSESAVSTCQCRYCDPIGQIWDADSIADLLNENSSVDFAPTKLEDSMKVVGPMGKRGADTTLRRSWSDPSSRAPERKDFGEANSSPNLYSLFPPTRRSSSLHEPRSPLALEISSEIVTSINGHRDLEIKFFSTSPPASANSERQSFFADNSESAEKGCSVADCNPKVNSAVTCDRVETSVDKECKQNSDNVSEAGCGSPFAVGDSPRNLCDLALVSV